MAVWSQWPILLHKWKNKYIFNGKAIVPKSTVVKSLTSNKVF